MGVTTESNQPITGQSIEAGGSGTQGWLSSVRKALTDRLPPALGPHQAVLVEGVSNGTPVSVTPAATENHLGQVGGNCVSIRGTLNTVSPGVIAAAGDYAAGDILSDAVTDTTGHHWVFANAVRVADGTGWITKLRATCSVAAATPRLRVWLFHTDPSASEKDDNAAFNLAAADRAKCLGYLDLPALASAGGVSFAQNITDRFRFTCASGSRDILAIVQTLDAFTNESALMTLDLHATIDQD